MKRIIFFDGVCVLCNGYVNLLIRIFSPGKIFFASLQGQYANNDPKLKDLGLDSIVYLRDGTYHRKSTAIIAILADAGYPYKIISIMLRIIPTKILDSVYDLIAENRYNIFGKTESCRIPSKQEKSYFLD